MAHALYVRGSSNDDLDSGQATLVYQPRSYSGNNGEDTQPSIEPDQSETDLEEVDLQIERSIKTKPSKFTIGVNELLKRKEQTFSDWLVEMEAAEKWRADCPLSFEKARNIQTCKVTELQSYGREFNSEIERILGRKPKIPSKEGVAKRKVREPAFVFLGTSEIGEFRKRLEIACKSFHGLGRDLDAIGKVMESKQAENKQLRQKLKECFETLEALYQKLGSEVQDLLGLDKNTMQGIEKHKNLLDDDTCPIVVAGQVSSGKSSLLNLFLGAGGRKETSAEDGTCADPFTLPVSVLACTGRVCEISYNDEVSAKLYEDKNGDTKDILIDDLSKHVDMYGQADSYKAEENIRDVVRLGLPIPFLKGGVTLVDTPGVGENVQDSEIVRNYIAKNNVFGFIFTIHTSAGSGVNEKFQQLLRDLTKYMDDNGNKKLDPEAVIFVCNFWDQIQPEERESTIKRVLEVLEATGFMKDFDCTKQLLFMNSKGAFDTWKVGYVSEDYNQLITAMERFFEIGHQKKVMQSYVWVHSLLQRMLRSVKFLQFWAQDIGAGTKDTFAAKLEDKLKKIKKAHSKEIEKLRHELPKSAERLAEKLLAHLKEKKTSVFSFDRNDILNLEIDKGNTDIQELKMDMMIDSQIGKVLNQWQAETKLVLTEKKKLERGITYVANFFDTRLSEFERRSVSVDKFKEGFEAMDKKQYQNAKDMVKNMRGASLDETKMDIAFGCTYGNALMRGCSIKQRAAMQGASIITDFAKMKGKGFFSLVPRRMKSTYLEAYKFTDYVTYRANTILSELMHKSVLTEIMGRHMQPIEELIKSVDDAIEARFAQNDRLIEVMKKELVTMMGTSDNKLKFMEQSSEINDVFSQLLRLGYSAGLEAIPFGDQNLAKDEHQLSCGCFGAIYAATTTEDLTIADKTIEKESKVTVKVIKGYLTESEQFFMLRHIGKVNDDHQLAPIVWGLSEQGYGLVFRGFLTTAKHYFIEMLKEKPQEEYRKDIASFLLTLADGLHYLHYKELVHPEVSVDSVFVSYQQDDGQPAKALLSNIAEKGSLRIDKKDGDKVGNLIYLPFECVQGLHLAEQKMDQLKSWYTSAGDMYGLGTVMLELYLRRADCLDNLKVQTFTKWCDKTDPGNTIKHAAISSTTDATNSKGQWLPEDWEPICNMCLKNKPEERITINKWIFDWGNLKERSHFKKEFSAETKEPQTPDIMDSRDGGESFSLRTEDKAW